MHDIAHYFADYGSHHQTRGNKLFHRLGIPMIMLTLIGMLARVTLFGGTISNGGASAVRIDAAMILIALSSLFYLALEWRLGLAMLVVSVGFYFIGSALPFWLNAALFILGWIFQFIGHSVYEKKQPAFLANMAHLLIGPLWILNDLLPIVKQNRPITASK